MTLGNFIRNRREELGLSQIELAEKSYTTQSMISKIESDKNVSSSSRLVAIAVALELPPSKLVCFNRKAG